MDENKDLNIPENPEACTAAAEDQEVREPELVPEASMPAFREEPEVADTESADLEVTEDTDIPEFPQATYRGVGAGRRESPFADASHGANPAQKRQEPIYRPAPEPAYRPVPEYNGGAVPHKSRNGGRIFRGVLAVVAVVALVAGSCGITAKMINGYWEARVAALDRSYTAQFQTLSQKIEELSPQNTGISVSGTADVAQGLTAGQIYARNVDSVVLIESTVSASMYGQTTTGVSTGTGFVLTEDGYVITNYHVIEGASSVAVGLHNGARHQAEVVGYDSINDIALLKVEATGLKAVELGSSDDLIVGDQVVAIGNPLGELTATLTAGYVSAKERTISTDGTIITMIQTDAAINSGNSGGPLFNMKGQVVGITTAKYSGSSSSGATIEGIGFAIPIDDILEEIGQLKEFGYIKSAYLGVMVQNMSTEAAGVYGLPVGAYVVSVEEGYCAQKAGIQAKDIIVAVGDEKISTIADLTRALRAYEPGDIAEITVFRSGGNITFKVVLDERPADADSATIQPQPQPEGEMPEGNFEEWYEFFAPFFGNGG